jgi:subtilisin family serine protease
LSGGRLIPAAAVAVALAAPAPAAAQSGQPTRLGERVQVVVTLAAPPLSQAVTQSRVLSDAAKTARLDLGSPTSISYLRSLAAEQRALARRITAAIPQARIRWRYSVVVNGMAVVLPRADVAQLGTVPGIARVYADVRYHSTLDRSPSVIGAPTLWGPALETAGQNLKIGVIDDGVDQSHPFFNPAGYTMPPGFPKGDRGFTTAKVIVARAFPPASPGWRDAGKPFDADLSEHGTHVAGIAAGNNALPINSPERGRTTISGVAPKAYIGNYKVLTIPTPAVGLDGNAAEIAAGIEAAVKDGMDVINLSLGEPEIERTRDLVVTAVDNAASAGVVPTIAAGNDFDVFGRGSIGSPGTARRAITAAAVSKTKVLASFSSGGPTPLSLGMKPDVSAPGVSILSSVPAKDGLYASFNGTSMAAPHVAGAAALLRERHPNWSVAQIKSALEQTGDPALTDDEHEAVTTREGGGLINLPRADNPLVFVTPTGISFGLMKPGATVSQALRVIDAGAGSGTWAVSVRSQVVAPSVRIDVPVQVTVPGRIVVRARALARAREQEATGFIVLTRGSDVRRIPYWLRTIAPLLGREPHGALQRTGTYRGTTRGKPSRVATYRYPEAQGLGIPVVLRGPEQVFRVRIARRVANFGVAVLDEAPNVDVEPRVVVAGDENRLTGYPALPINLNPYLSIFGRPDPTAGAIRPAAGAYDVVFDSTSPARAGRFTFRFWINDTTPPRIQLLTPAVAAGQALRLEVNDAGSGVDPRSISALIDGTAVVPAYDAATGRVSIEVGGLATGRHQLVFQVSDYQESKNMENVPPILPNTRQLRKVLIVR